MKEQLQEPQEEHRRFEELWDGRDDPEVRKIHLKTERRDSNILNKGRKIYLSYFLCGIMLFVLLIAILKKYLS